MIAIDTETCLIDAEEPVPNLVSVAIASDTTQELWGSHESGLEARLENAFLTEECVFFNAPFDVSVIIRAFPALEPTILRAYNESRIIDAQLVDKMIDIALGEKTKDRRYNLGAVAKRRAGIDVDKNDPWRMRYHELLGIDPDKWPESAQHYAEFDAWATLKVYQAQLELARKLDIPLDNHAHQAKAYLALYAQTTLGVMTDSTLVTALDDRLSREIETHKQACIEAGLMYWTGPKKSQKLSKKMSAAQDMIEEFAKASGASFEQTPTGKPALGKEALANLEIPEGHALHHFRALGAKTTLRTKTIVPFKNPIVRTSYDIVVSGRTSSSADSKYPSTNLQNIPRDNDFRRCLRARPGYTLVVSDWGQAELVTLAQVQINLFGRSALGDALNAGMDPHINMACQILGIEYEQFSKSIPAHVDARQMAKAANFGLPGGLGVTRFRAFAKNEYGVLLSEYEARRLKEKFLRQWTEMALYFRYIDRQGSTIKHHWSGRLRGGCKYTDACNTLFQGLAADAAKVALWGLYMAGKDPSSPMFGSRQVLFVHDENVTEAPIERAEAVLKEQERIMIESFAVCCPDVPIKVESFISTNYRK